MRFCQSYRDKPLNNVDSRNTSQTTPKQQFRKDVPGENWSSWWKFSRYCWVISVSHHSPRTTPSPTIQLSILYQECYRVINTRWEWLPCEKIQVLTPLPPHPLAISWNKFGEAQPLECSNSIVTRICFTDPVLSDWGSILSVFANAALWSNL